MTIQLLSSPGGAPYGGRISASMVVRAALTILVFSIAIVPVFAADRPKLRGDVVANGDVITMADLLVGTSGPSAVRPLFRAPALGETGTIQVRRILDAAQDIGVAGIETDGRVQVTVTRATRRIGSPEIEAAVKRALETQHGVDAHSLSVLFDDTPSMVVAPDVKTPVGIEELVYDRRSRRVSALASISPNPGERRAAIRVTGALVELVEVAVLTRSLDRGETVKASDITFERRVRDSLPRDVQDDGLALIGRVARRPLGSGVIIRAGDLARPEIVGRGDVVTIVYEVPGLVLTMRGRASEAGALGDTIAVVNPQSKKTLQAVVAAPGKVTVGAPLAGPIASAAPTPRP
jgi:flagella basal body P-ring formation protein FlgA